jgi:hypothetical protein
MDAVKTSLSLKVKTVKSLQKIKQDINYRAMQEARRRDV